MSISKYNDKAKQFVKDYGYIISTQVSGFRVIKVETDKGYEIEFGLLKQIYLGLINIGLDWLRIRNGNAVIKQFYKEYKE